MRNLAGNTAADIPCAAELRDAGIEIVMLDKPQRDEVPTRVTGKIGDIVLTRAWVYWRAHGNVPLAIADRLYADPIGKVEVRVNGNCTCPAPGEPGGRIEWFDGAEPVIIDSDGSEEAEFDALIARGTLKASSKPKFAKHPGGLAGYITSYHIDSAEGLRLFAQMVRPT